LETSMSDILILPQPPDVIAFSLRKAARERAGGQTRLSRVVMVSSTKGGTGKTSIAVNGAVGRAALRPAAPLLPLHGAVDGAMLTALDRSDQLLLVSTPDVPSMKNIRLALQTLELLGFPLDRVALVANRSGMAGGASVSEMSDTIGRDVRFVLPEDPAVPA